MYITTLTTVNTQYQYSPNPCNDCFLINSQSIVPPMGRLHCFSLKELSHVPRYSENIIITKKGNLIATNGAKYFL